MSGAGCTFIWQCIHCSGTLPLLAGTNLPFCPFCKAPSQPPDAPPVDGDNGQSQIVYSADNHRENPRAQLKHDSEESFVHLSKETTESPFVTDPAPPRRATTQSQNSPPKYVKDGSQAHWSSTTIQGLNAASDRKLKLIFHVIVPVSCWDWKESSKVCIRFDHKELGNWRSVGDFYILRIHSEGYHEMCCTFEKFDSNLLANENAIAYKYVVKYGHLDEVEECIHSSSGDLRRCLKISSKVFSGVKSKGEHHKYDTIIYPKKTLSESTASGEKPKLKKMAAKFLGHKSTETSSEERFNGPRYLNDFENRNMCLQIYFKPFVNLICKGGFERHNPLFILVEEFYVKYSSLFKFISVKSNEVVIDAKLNQEGLAAWLGDVVKILLENPLRNPTQQLTAAAFIVLCYSIYMIQKPCNQNEIVEGIIRLLAIHHDDYVEQYDLLCSCLVNWKERSLLADYIEKFCAMLPESVPSEEQIKDYMMALTLSHFLRELCKPWSAHTINMPHEVKVKKAGLQDMKKIISDNITFVESFYPRLEMYFQLNPFLVHVFLYLSPESEFVDACKHFEPSITCTFLYAKATRQTEKMKLADLQIWASSLMNVTDSLSELNESCSIEDIHQVLKLCTSLLMEFSSVSSDSFLVVIKEIVNLILHAAFFHEAHCIEARDVKAEPCFWYQKIHFSLSNGIERWLSTFGGEMLGGSKRHVVGLKDSWKQKAKVELKVWRELLSVNKEKWFVSMIKDIVTSRIMAMRSIKHGIELVGLIDETSKLADVVMEAVLQCIDDSQQKPKESGINIMDPLLTTKSTNVSILLGRVLLKQYSTQEDIKKITFDDLLGWSLWPTLITMLLNSPAANDQLLHGCVDVRRSAHKVMLDIAEKLHRRKVKLREVEKIKDNHEQMIKLCQATFSSSDSAPYSLEQLKHNVKSSIEEYDEFVYYKTALSHLSRMIESEISDVQGLADLKTELQRDYSEETIDNICLRDSSDHIQLCCYRSAETLLTFVSEFYDVTCGKFSSDLFKREWTDALRCATSIKAHLHVNEIESAVWMECKLNCEVLLKSLLDQTIPLSEIDERFAIHESDIETQLLNFYKGVKRITRAISGDQESHVFELAYRIKEYWELLKYHKAADALIKLKSFLFLHGCFSEVETLFEELCKAIEHPTLIDVDTRILESATLLKDIIIDIRRIDCLEKLVNCVEIVQWLKTETKGLNDVKNFVSVSLATAAGGESDLINDRLLNLRTVGCGFASLLYGLEETAGSLELLNSLEPVWNALDDNHGLPELLDACNRHISWYRSVKAMQGSLEETSYGQMRNILMCGCFLIGTVSLIRPAHSLHDLVSLKLKSENKKIDKQTYTIEELRDLESRLVLITGSKVENRTEVDHYLDILQHVYRISELLLALQKAGNVEYLKWMITFDCSHCYDNQGEEPKLNAALATCHTDELLSCEKRMELDLIKWNQEVNDSRKVYYELNYYTTTQLLKLRNELAMIESNPDKDLDSQVINLLQGISPDISSDSVHKETDESETFVNLSMVTSSSPVLQSQSDSKTQREMSHRSIAQNTTLSEESPVVTQPSISEDELTDEQQQILTDLCESLMYKKSLVLKAIEMCQPSQNYRYDILTWCNKNEAQYKFDEQSVTSDEGYEESSESEDESESCSLQHMDPEQLISDSYHGHAEINESHPSVRTLVEQYKYKQEVAAEAVALHNDLDGALSFLSRKERMRVKYQPGSSLLSAGSKHQSSTQSFPGVIVIKNDDYKEQFLNLNEVGKILGNLSKKLPVRVKSKRPFREDLEAGSPNLIVVPPEDVLKAVISLYMEDSTLPLPTHEEVLICNPNTSSEEVSILWHRSVNDPGYKRIFCLVYAEKLSYKICDEVLQTLKSISYGKQGYRLVIVCSKDGDDRSLIISKLFQHKKSISESVLCEEKCKMYLRKHFIQSSQRGQLKASSADNENSCVRVISSTRSGMGKSLYIRRMTEKLTSGKDLGTVCVTVPIHGPVVTPEVVLRFLKSHFDDNKAMIYHFDIAPNAILQVNTILFSLLILQGLTDSEGLIWRCYSSKLYVVEVTLLESEDIQTSNTATFLRLLPTVQCLSPLQIKSITGNITACQIGIDFQEFYMSKYQRVLQYLKKYDNKKNLDKFVYEKREEGSASKSLQLLLQYCGVKDPSWSEIHHFTKFLNMQLESSEQSVFMRRDGVGNMFPGLKSFVVKFVIKMSEDFATPSLQGEIERDKFRCDKEDIIKQYEIHRLWDGRLHHYIFFNEDRVTITLIGFSISPKGDLIHNGKVSVSRIITKDLYNALMGQGVNLSENCTEWKRCDMIMKLSIVMGIKCFTTKDVDDPDESYVLTVDNLIKMLAIQTRFRCDIPVVVIGETGCGKTRLIRYMCDLAKQKSQCKNLLIMKVHGGTTEDDIREFVTKAEETVRENEIKFRNSYVEKEMKSYKAATVDTRVKMKRAFEKEAVEQLAKKPIEVVVFFDEANTTEAIGLIKEIMCDRQLFGKPISKNLRFIAACNPYRIHTKEMICKLESAGLGFYIKATETQQKIGRVPLRQLVYRVIDIPPSMRPFVYDFGHLHQDAEVSYIRQIVSNHLLKHSSLENNSKLLKAVTDVLAASQEYMRLRKDECSFVSLRDVERAMIVFDFFYERKDDFTSATRRKKPLSTITSAVVLAINICYNSKLQDRQYYETRISKMFHSPLSLGMGGVKNFRKEIEWYQDVLLDNMKVGQNIAKNAALRENVFMMVICIELRIPLFLVGKPGSSKSLAKSIIQDSLHGKNSCNGLLKTFKPVQMLSYQCSQLSSSESIKEVFKKAKKIQDQSDPKYISVVVLDEVGLAEDSPRMPLKILHPLLEDGTDEVDKIIDREERVAFIGISNWALDPAKMNRGVMITRGIPDIDELQFSARGICGKEDNDEIRLRLQPFFKPLAEAYQDICRKQEREFFGLRDFYSLIKMLYWMCKRSKGRQVTWPQMKHAIMRNFGGWESDKVNPFEEFRRRLNMDKIEPDRKKFNEEEWAVINPDCTQLGLIKTSLSTREQNFHGENRYLLFLTENYAALQVMEHYITCKKLSLAASPEASAELRPYTLFGSSFPKDKEYTQICRNINQVKICMETGRTVILLNLETLYESLYDLLNQYYLEQGGNRYVDLGLQTHRVKCRVHPEFKLILIADRETVYQKFPIPLINRLEKHFVLTSSVLEGWQEEVLNDFQKWIKEFSTVRDENFKESHAFVGYQRDTAASVVFQSSRQFESLKLGNSALMNLLKKSILFNDQDFKVEHIIANEERGSILWKQAVLRLSQYLLLQTATDDAIVRLQKTTLSQKQEDLFMIYFSEQHHNSIVDFVQHHQKKHDHSKGALMMQVTTHSHLLLREEIEDIGKHMNMNVEPLLLHEFDTKVDFCNKIGPALKKANCLVVVQCDSGHKNSDLIACTRQLIYDERIKALEENENSKSYILLIVSLPHQFLKSSFTSFQGDPWISAHIDDLNPRTNAVINSQEDITATISELFIGEFISGVDIFEESECGDRDSISVLSRCTVNSTPSSIAGTDFVMHNIDLSGVPRKYPVAQCSRLHSLIQAAASKLEDSTTRRTVTRVSLLTKLIPRKPPQHLSTNDFYSILVVRLFKLLQERESIRPDVSDWVLKEALNKKNIQLGGTFKNVLARKLDSVVTPLLANIIAFIDRDCNLDLLRTDSQTSACTKLWLAMFCNSQATVLKYCDIAQGIKLPGSGRQKSNQLLKCQMPFYWIIVQAVDCIWDNANRFAVEGMKIHHTQLCRFLVDTVVGQVLMAVPKQDSEELFVRYLHDFVRYVHVCGRHNNIELNELEFKHIESALNSNVHNTELNADGSLVSRIAALHITYAKNTSQILRFGQLALYWPSILHNIPTHDGKTVMELELHAVKYVMDQIEPPLETDKPYDNLVQWLGCLQLSQSHINIVLSSTTTDKYVSKIRFQWQRIYAIKLFVECVMQQHEEADLKYYARRLNDILKGEPNLMKAETLNMIMTTLTNMETNLKKIHEKETVRMIKKSSRHFFLEVVSKICFSLPTLPESDLIKMLINTLFMDSDSLKTQNVSTQKVKVPTVRSFLLQLLLDYSMDDVRIHVAQCLEKCQTVLPEQESQDMSLMIVHCFEDAYLKKFSHEPFLQRLSEVQNLLKEGSQMLHEKCSEQFHVGYLEAVSKVRYSLSMVAELLGEPSFKTHDCQRLLETTREICEDPILNKIGVETKKNGIGPANYLVKLISKRYGMPCLKTVAEDHAWILPTYLKPKEFGVMDPFVLYDKPYKSVRKAVYNAVQTCDVEDLGIFTQGEDYEFMDVYIALSLYEKVTLPKRKHGCTTDKILEKMDRFVRNYYRSSNLLLLARSLIANQQGNRCLEQMIVSPEQQLKNKLITGVVIHATAIFLCQCKASVHVLHPFVNILLNPAALKQTLLPTMQEIPLLDVKKAMFEGDQLGHFCECPRGHIYFIGDCGNAWVRSKCNVCRCTIGGTDHKRDKGNKVVKIKSDKTVKGHDLGSPQFRTLASAERNLSASAVCIMRALMHAAFIWASCSNSKHQILIASLIYPRVPQNGLAEFFWNHLEKDIDLLCAHMKRGIDEVIMILHLVLGRILTTTPPRGQNVQYIKSLKTTDERKEWEDAFNKSYIQPVLNDLDDKLTLIMNVIADDKDRLDDHDPLLNVVNERAVGMEESFESNLWMYRSKITPEHILHTLEVKEKTKAYPILYEFLHNEVNLRATSFLPDLARLQRYFYDIFNHQIDRREANTLTIKQFTEQISNLSERKMCTELIESFTKAWQLVGHKLKCYGRLSIEEDFFISNIDCDTPIEYLIPTTSGPGLCCTSLVDFLTQSHNTFIEFSRRLDDERRQNTKSFWREHKVDIAHLHQCHVLNFEQQLPAVILSHCHYSLRVGRGHHIQYDHKSLEKHILNHFIQGKPIIVLDIPQVIFREDIYTTGTFSDVKLKVVPQEKLPKRVRMNIISELSTPDRLRETLDVIEIVLGFLSSSGGRAEKSLGHYIDKTLKMKKKRFSQEAKDFCKLKHVLSLWSTISVELAKQLYTKEQEPFNLKNKKFIRGLSKDEDGENQIEALDNFLLHADADQCIGIIFEFVETYIKEANDQESDEPLIETMKLVYDDPSNDIDDFFFDYFPKSIKLDQAVAAWKYIVSYYSDAGKQ